MRQRSKAALLAGLAPLFNGILGITPGFFGATRSSLAPAAGVMRARAREKAYREAQAERLKDAAAPVVTRQQRRSYAIRGR